MTDWLAGGTKLSGMGMKPRFTRNRRLNSRGTRKTIITRKLSKKSKANLRRNLVMLGEKKFYQSNVSALGVSTAGRVDQLSDLAQGDADTNRDRDRDWETSPNYDAN